MKIHTRISFELSKDESEIIHDFRNNKDLLNEFVKGGFENFKVDTTEVTQQSKMFPNPKTKICFNLKIDNDIHDLKITPQYFNDIVNFTKPFELRKNDRNYKKGDYLYLRSFHKNAYTGNKIIRKITYVLKDCEKYGLQNGFVILGINKI